MSAINPVSLPQKVLDAQREEENRIKALISSVNKVVESVQYRQEAVDKMIAQISSSLPPPQKKR